MEHLRGNLSKDKKTQKADNARIMKQNVKLIEEINDLQKALHKLHLETRTEQKRQKELTRIKRAGGQIVDPDVQKPQNATA